VSVCETHSLLHLLCEVILLGRVPGVARHASDGIVVSAEKRRRHLTMTSSTPEDPMAAALAISVTALATTPTGTTSGSSGPNTVWSYDVVFDARAVGR